jgi:bifunctional DNA-binding transcriptional regulator/antitoxin component of YhaV-PrlF toxin-antitoxin module
VDRVVKQSRRRGFTRLSSKRQVTLPIALVEELNLKPGDEFSVGAEAGRIVLAPEESLAARRRRALAKFAGSMPGVWKPGDLERLRNEWR